MGRCGLCVAACTGAGALASTAANCCCKLSDNGDSGRRGKACQARFKASTSRVAASCACHSASAAWRASNTAWCCCSACKADCACSRAWMKSVSRCFGKEARSGDCACCACSASRRASACASSPADWPLAANARAAATASITARCSATCASRRAASAARAAANAVASSGVALMTCHWRSSSATWFGLSFSSFNRRWAVSMLAWARCVSAAWWRIRSMRPCISLATRRSVLRMAWWTFSSRGKAWTCSAAIRRASANSLDTMNSKAAASSPATAWARATCSARRDALCAEAAACSATTGSGAAVLLAERLKRNSNMTGFAWIKTTIITKPGVLHRTGMYKLPIE